MARALLSAIRLAGYEPELASTFRSYEGQGNQQQQQRLRLRAAIIRQRILNKYLAMTAQQRPAAWFSYHLYHKAPDLLGPQISRTLNIPYIVAEASHAPKQAGGPWHDGYLAAREAMLMAASVIALNPVDIACVEQLLATSHGVSDRVSRLPPFFDAQRFRNWSQQKDACRKLSIELGLEPDIPVLICVAMMRSRAKMDSYTLLAAALKAMTQIPWQLVIVGDGPARRQVESLFNDFSGRVRFVGCQKDRRLAQHMGLADIFVWPAINEAWGMVFMEAAAAGLPCVAGSAGGVPQVVSDQYSGLLVPVADRSAFGRALLKLLTDSKFRQKLSKGAIDKVLGEHDLQSAATRLEAIFDAQIIDTF